jgi:thiamine biosynthesis lipoprotein
MFTHEFRAMGSRIFLAMDSEKDPWPEFGAQVSGWFEEWEQSLSRFRSTSELSQFNRRSGEWQPVSETFWQVLELALAVERKTDGIVTPAVLDALEAAGYDVTFEEIGSTADTWLRQPIFETTSVRDIELDATTCSVKTPKGLRLDFGGVAKGWAAHQTMLRLAGIAPVLVDAGGDIAISAPLQDGTAWPINIADPFDPAGDLGLLMIPSGSVATSGRDYRRWLANGRWQHHLIDPRTNQPAQTDVFTATVVAENLLEAEALSKQALILGSDGAKELFDQFPDRAFLLMREDGSTVQSDSFEQFRWKASCKITDKISA